MVALSGSGLTVIAAVIVGALLLLAILLPNA
jgi:hypothetical protein